MKNIWASYVTAVELMVALALVLTFGIRGIVDVVVYHAYFWQNYISVSVRSVIGAIAFFGIIALIEYFNLKRKAKK